MKKLISKLPLRRSKKQLEAPADRITSDTLAEHREKVLAGGRKFKYPVQYARHKLVLNAIIISVGALILLAGAGWYALYKGQTTSEFMYHVTRVIPVPVAVVDGQPVRYSDYLMMYRSYEHYLVEKGQVDVTTKDGKSQLDFYKSQAMDDVIADAYAAKLAQSLNISVSDADFETFLKQQRQSSDGEVSEATYNAVINDYYDWSPSEYREAMKRKLLRQKVAYAVDDTAQSLAKNIETMIGQGNTDLNDIAAKLNAPASGTVTYWAESWVPKSNQDGGLAAAAAQLKKGQISTAVKTSVGDGYYYVKLIDSNATQVQYSYIHVPLKAFDNQLETAENDGKVQKYIDVEDVMTQE